MSNSVTYLLLLTAAVSCVGVLSLSTETPAVKLPWLECGPRCFRHCPYGQRMDYRGCPTCDCYEAWPFCPQIQCLLACPNGFKIVNGCPSCQCKDVVADPCPYRCQLSCARRPGFPFPVGCNCANCPQFPPFQG